MTASSGSPTEDLGDGAPLATFEWDQDDDRRVIRVAGEIDVSNAHLLLEGADDPGQRSVVVDLKATTFIDSTGLAKLVELREMISPGQLSVLIQEGGQADRIISVAGLGETLSVGY